MRDAALRRGRGLGRLGCLGAAVLIVVVLVVAAAALIWVVKLNIGNDNGPEKIGRSDDAIRADVQAALRSDARLPAGGAFVVNVQDGLVTLSGAVDTFEQKAAAGAIVRHTAGAALLVNQIQVRPPVPISDQELQQKIATGLGLQDATARADLTVAVSAGVVTLGGTVDSLATKLRAEQIASSVAGVRDLRDTIVVHPSVARTDDEIAVDVRASIAADPILRDQDIRVRVTDGTVTLTGAVRDLTSRQLAENLAAFTRGARALDNQLQVQR